MDEASSIAEWLRQRDGETDVAWVERFRATFTFNVKGHDDPKADRIGDRLRSRLQARRKAGRSDK